MIVKGESEYRRWEIRKILTGLDGVDSDGDDLDV